MNSMIGEQLQEVSWMFLQKKQENSVFFSWIWLKCFSRENVVALQRTHTQKGVTWFWCTGRRNRSGVWPVWRPTSASSGRGARAAKRSASSASNCAPRSTTPTALRRRRRRTFRSPDRPVSTSTCRRCLLHAEAIFLCFSTMVNCVTWGRGPQVVLDITNDFLIKNTTKVEAFKKNTQFHRVLSFL